MVELVCAYANQKEEISSLEKELVASQVAQKVAEAELEATLKSMKYGAMDATLHARFELMEEFKADNYSE